MNIFNYINKILNHFAIYRRIKNKIMEELMHRCMNIISQQYSFTERLLLTPMNHDFVNEKRFRLAHNERKNSPYSHSELKEKKWHLHVVLWAASQAFRRQTNIIQLGVFEGGEAAAILKYCDFNKKKSKIFLIDTFNGNPESLWSKKEIKLGADSAQWLYKKAGSTCDYVKERFKKYTNVFVIEGVVPNILKKYDFHNIGLLFLDLNAAKPEKDALEYLWEKLTPGAIILSDDYGHSSANHGYYEQKKAFDRFAKSKKLEVLYLPTGHGMLIKP